MKKNKYANKEYHKKKEPISFFKGAALVAGVSIMTVKILPKISSKLYKESVKKSNQAMKDSDWGPVIERIKNKGD